MISISKPQGAKQAKDYLSKESYYQQNGELGQWHGSMIALHALGLKDGQSIEKKTYARILDGVHPQSKTDLLSNSGGTKRRAGIDVTFSAPKSVSLLMELAEGLGQKFMEHSIRIAHEAAVQYAMKKLSNTYVKTRIRKGKGKRETVASHALWASFQHDTTRETDSGEIDPQLHTHNFLMALTFFENPQDGSLKAYAMSNEEIYANKMFLGQVYRNALEKNLRELGLDTVVTNREQGFFELKGFSNTQLEAFSGRRGELLEKLALSDLKSDNQAKLLDLVNAKSKKHKQKIDRKALLRHNIKRMEHIGIDGSLLQRFVQNVFESSFKKIDQEEKQSLTKEHLQKALALLEEHHSIFSIEEIMKNVLKFGLDYGLVLEDYDSALEESMKEGSLIKLDSNVYSTKAIVEAEREVIRLMIQGKESLPGYTRKKNAEGFIDQHYENMTQGQRDMVAGVLGTEDQFIVIQGDAGTGKTYAASAIHDFMLLQHPSTEVLGLSFTGKAAQSLEEESGISSSTLHSFLYREHNRSDSIPKRRLILVDEAGMAGSLQIAKLMQVARENDDRIVFIGDTKQFSSIAAGNIFLDMQKYGAQTVYMSETMRQKSDYAKGIVKSVKRRDVDKAMDILQKRGSMIEMEQREMVESISREYSKRYASSDPLEDELIIASRNVERVAINDRIREHIGTAGEGETHTIRQIHNQNGLGRYFTDALEEGMLIIPSKVPETKNGAEYRIVSIVDERNIEVTTSSGKVQTIDFYQHSQKCQVIKEVEKEFSMGDTILFTKNVTLDDGIRVKNGERAVIESIENGIVKTTLGKIVNISSMNFIDHGYAITDYKSQGATTKNVTICADSQMASLNSFYTQVTRAKENIMLYTANKEALLANLKKDAKKRSTLEYTMNGQEIESTINRRSAITSNFKQAGIYLSSITGRTSKAEQLLELPQDVDNTEIKVVDSFFETLEKALQKADQLFGCIEKRLRQKSKFFNKSPNKIPSILNTNKKAIRRPIATIKP